MHEHHPGVCYALGGVDWLWYERVALIHFLEGETRSPYGNSEVGADRDLLHG